jgi:hypothetical protein
MSLISLVHRSRMGIKTNELWDKKERKQKKKCQETRALPVNQRWGARDLGLCHLLICDHLNNIESWHSENIQETDNKPAHLYSNFKCFIWPGHVLITNHIHWRVQRELRNKCSSYLLQARSFIYLISHSLQRDTQNTIWSFMRLRYVETSVIRWVSSFKALLLLQFFAASLICAKEFL